jgi:hypothetical protein
VFAIAVMYEPSVAALDARSEAGTLSRSANEADAPATPESFERKGIADNFTFTTAAE